MNINVFSDWSEFSRHSGDMVNSYATMPEGSRQFEYKLSYVDDTYKYNKSDIIENKDFSASNLKKLEDVLVDEPAQSAYELNGLLLSKTVDNISISEKVTRSIVVELIDNENKELLLHVITSVAFEDNVQMNMDLIGKGNWEIVDLGSDQHVLKVPFDMEFLINPSQLNIGDMTGKFVVVDETTEYEQYGSGQLVLGSYFDSGYEVKNPPALFNRIALDALRKELSFARLIEH